VCDHTFFVNATQPIITNATVVGFLVSFSWYNQQKIG